MFLLMVAYLVLVLIRPQDYPVLLESPGLSWQPVVLVLAALFWLLSPRKSFEAPQYLLLLCFLLVLMLSQIANGWTGGALVQFTKFAPVVLAFVLLANAVDTRERVVAVMAVFTVCAGVLALHGIEQSRTGVGWTGVTLSQQTRIQYVGIFNDPNDLGMLFVMCLPMSVHLSMRGGFMGLRRLFWLTVAGVLLYGIYLTNSRGTMLALVVLLGVYVWQRRGAVTAGMMGVAALAALMLLPSRMQDLDVGEASANGRVESWYEGLHMFLSRPLLGIGPDGYSDMYNLTAHNSFVLVLAETGIIGFTIWVAFIGYCFRMVLAVLRRQEETGEVDAIGDAHTDTELETGRDGNDGAATEWQEDRAIAMTLLLALSGFFAAAFFLSRSYVVTLYLLTALVVGHYSGMQARYAGLPRFRLEQDLLRWPLWSTAGVAGLYVVVKVLLGLV